MSAQNLPSSFEKLLLEANRPVLVDFWADWCAPCRALAPTLQDVAKAYKGRLFVVKVNTDQKPEIAARYQIQGIPTLILFDKGQILWRSSGALPYQHICSVLDSKLG